MAVYYNGVRTCLGFVLDEQGNYMGKEIIFITNKKDNDFYALDIVSKREYPFYHYKRANIGFNVRDSRDDVSDKRNYHVNNDKSLIKMLMKLKEYGDDISLFGGLDYAPIDFCDGVLSKALKGENSDSIELCNQKMIKGSIYGDRFYDIESDTFYPIANIIGDNSTIFGNSVKEGDLVVKVNNPVFSYETSSEKIDLQSKNEEIPDSLGRRLCYRR